MINQPHDANSRPFVFNDAVELIEGKPSSALGISDRFATASILAAGVTGFPGAFSLLGPKNELVKLGERLQKKIPHVVAGSQGIDRTRLLVAAHSIVVITSFFGAASLIQNHVPDAEVTLTGKEELQVAAKNLTDKEDTKLNELIDLLTKTDIPHPKPEFAPGDMQRTLETFYESAAANLSRFCRGLRFWDDLDDRNRGAVDEFFKMEVPRLALEQYESSLRVLAAKVQEFEIWLNQIATSGIRDDVRKYGQAASDKIDQLLDSQRETAQNFEELRIFLLSVSPEPKLRPGQSSEFLDRISSAALPSINPPEVARLTGNSGASIPPLSILYVESPFKVVTGGTNSDVNREDWWERIPTRHNMDVFFSTYLTSELSAFRSPLLVLGHPGSGKSSLTRVLASRLPLTRYFPILVELRGVTPSRGIEIQIGESLTMAMGGRTTTWSDVRNATDLTPVLFLDGLDELIQASSVKQGDYLEQIELFQQRELRNGGGVIVIVTSRTVVADHARIPIGSLVIKIEDFGSPEIRQFVKTWNEYNSEYFERTGVRPLPYDLPTDVQQLAGQPLLLLLLALLDADSNALQSNMSKRTKASIYGQIITNFMSREILKHEPTSDAAGAKKIVQHELLRLSYVAVGMFNRGIQMISDQQVLEDLSTVTSKEARVEQLEDVHKLMGRFFFVHRAVSESSGGSKQAYEFLHSTFGEYLVAHLAREVALEVIDSFQRMASSRFAHSHTVDDVAAMLFAFQPFSQRTPILEFLAELMAEEPATPRMAETLVLLATLRLEGGGETMNSLGTYRPNEGNAHSRLAVYTCNLLLVAGALYGSSDGESEPIHASIPNIQVWNSFVHLWKSQLDPSAWTQLSKVLWARSSAPLSQYLEADHKVEVGLDFLTPPSDSKYGLVPISEHQGELSTSIQVVKRNAVPERLTLQLLAADPVLRPRSEISIDRSLYFLAFEDRPYFFDPTDLFDKMLNSSLGIVPNNVVQDSLVLLLDEPDCYEWILRHLRGMLASPFIVDFRRSTVRRLVDLALLDPDEDLRLTATVFDLLAEGALGRDSFPTLERAIRSLDPDSFLPAHPAFAVRVATALRFGGYEIPECPQLRNWEWLVSQATLSALYHDDREAPLQVLTIARQQKLYGWATSQGIAQAALLPGSVLRRTPIDDAVFLLQCGALDVEDGFEKVKQFSESWVEAHDRTGGRGLQLAAAIRAKQTNPGMRLNEAIDILSRFWA